MPMQMDSRTPLTSRSVFWIVGERAEPESLLFCAVLLVLPDPLLLVVHSSIDAAGDPSEGGRAIDVGRQASLSILCCRAD